MIYEKHKNNILAFIDELKNSNKPSSVEEENFLASKLLSEFDEFYLAVYGFVTDDPDKYVGLLVGTYLPDLNDADIEKKRKILGMVKLEETPYSYRYFHEHLKHVTSQFDQDGVIEAIFDLIGTRDKFFIEIGGGNSFDNSYLLRTQK